MLYRQAKQRTHYVKPLNLLFAPINKNASSALVTALKDRWGPDRNSWHSREPGDVPEGAKMVVMLREPIDRCWSAFKFLRRGRGCHPGGKKAHQPWVPRPNMPNLVDGFDNFVKELADWDVEYLDLHLLPQWHYMMAPCEHILVPWDFEQFADIFDLPEIPALNTNRDPSPLSLSDETERLLKEIYAPDLRLWELARKK